MSRRDEFVKGSTKFPGPWNHLWTTVKEAHDRTRREAADEVRLAHVELAAIQSASCVFCFARADLGAEESQK